ncbi:MAG: hypothetical protein U0Q19_07060 [Kineosporiaceae bacterium]
MESLSRVLEPMSHGSPTVIVRLTGADLSLFEGKLLRANCHDVSVVMPAPGPEGDDSSPGITLTIRSRRGADVIRGILADCLESGASSISLEDRLRGITVVVASSRQEPDGCWRIVNSVLWY